MTAILLVALVILTFVSFIFTVYLAAKENWLWFTTCPTGHIKAIAKNGVIFKIISNVTDPKSGPLHHDWATDTMVNGAPDLPANPILNILQEKFGLYYVGIFWPIYQVVVWEFKHSQIIESDGNGQIIYSLKDISEQASSLPWQIQHKILAKDIELKGQYEVDVVVRVIFQIVKPHYLIGALNGSWFGQAANQTSGLVDNLTRPLDINSIQTTDKVELYKAGLVDRLIVNGAIKIADAVFVNVSYGKNTAEALEAILAGQTATLKGDAKKIAAKKEGEAGEITAEIGVKVAKFNATAVVETAKGKADAIKIEGQAESDARKAILSAVSTIPEGASMFRTEKLAQGIANHKGTLVIGSNSTPLVSLGEEKKTEVGVT